MPAKILKNTHRHDIVKFLQGNQNIGIELGVAKGVFSQRMVKSQKFSQFIGIDMYADGHDTTEYKEALKTIGLFENYKLLRMRFDEALGLFEDQSLDFIYVDGYAHSGEEGGQTPFDWCKKVKIGGIMAGDDYHSDWPLVVKAIDEFVKQSGFELWITDKTEDDPYCRYPTWMVKKTHEPQLNLPQNLIEEGRIANQKVMRSRRLYTILLRNTEYLRGLVPKKIKYAVWIVIKKLINLK